MKTFFLHKNQLDKLFRVGFITVLLILTVSVVFAQNSDCDVPAISGKITTKKYITFDRTILDTTTLKQVLNLSDIQIREYGELTTLNALDSIHTSRTTESNWAVIEGLDIENMVLSNNSVIHSESPVYLTQNNEELVVTHLFYVKLYNSTDLQLLENLAQENNIEILGNNKFMPLWHTLSCDKNSTGNTLQMATLFSNSGLFEIVQPDFLINIELSCVNDPLFPNQWGLENTGQLNPLYTELDINLCQAHQITTGNTSVIVAVIESNLIDRTHPDLTNIHPDFSTNLNPNNLIGMWHATGVAGIIGANKDNGVGITGVSPDCPIMTIGAQGGVSPGIGASYAGSFSFAYLHGASVINNSWKIGDPNSVCFELINDAILSAMSLGRNGLGSVVVFASANDNASTVSYPSNLHPDIITVGAIDPCGKRLSPSSCIGSSGLSGSNYGELLDVVAPGVLIPTTDVNSSYQDFSQTSSAAPHVSGVAALILSVNPCLSQRNVGDIIMSTAQKIRPDLYNYQTTFDRPNGTWHPEVGHGLVDAFESVKVAQASYSATLDLYTKDSYNDFGVTPNITTQYPWLSEDIWVRNQADGLTNFTHQNPINNQSNYVYVRVRNKSCVPSDGTETLDLSWAKASTSLNYPTYWNGTLDLDPPNNALAGDLVASQNIPIIPAGGEVILEFTWSPPSPSDYSFNSEPWHFCLLSQINTPSDPITPFTNIGAYVTENNNVAWKNLTVVDNMVNILADCSDDVMQNIGTTVAVANPDNIAATFDIKFSVPQEELSNPITTEGNITVALDEQLYEKWKQGGRKGSGFIEVKSPPMSDNGSINNNINEHSPITLSNRNLFEITATSSSFDNITLTPNEVRTTSLMVTYPSNPVSEKEEFSYDIIQKRSDSEEIIGGVRYAIQKPNCDLLNNIDAGENQYIKKGCSAALVASPVSKCSSYKWYDDSGKLVSEEPVVKITPNKTTTYTLKYVSSSGCIDEDKVTITASNQLCKKEREIIKVTPNPANDFITIDYKTVNTNSAHVRLLKTDNSIDRTYPLDLQNNQKTINVSDCNFGSYVLMLVCDGINEDSEVIIIQ